MFTKVMINIVNEAISTTSNCALFVCVVGVCASPVNGAVVVSVNNTKANKNSAIIPSPSFIVCFIVRPRGILQDTPL